MDHRHPCSPQLRKAEMDRGAVYDATEASSVYSEGVWGGRRGSSLSLTHVPFLPLATEAEENRETLPVAAE